MSESGAAVDELTDTNDRSQRPWLLNLPVEIKSMIFSYIWGNLTLRLLPDHIFSPASSDTNFPRWMSMLYISKHFREEALVYFYTHATFHLYRELGWGQHIRRIPTGLQHIQKAHIVSLRAAIGVSHPGYGEEYVSFQALWAKFRQTYPAMKEVTMPLSNNPDQRYHARSIYNNRDAIKFTFNVSTETIKLEDARIFTKGINIEFRLYPGRKVVIKYPFISRLPGRAKEEWVACLNIVLQHFGLTVSNVHIVEQNTIKGNKS